MMFDNLIFHGVILFLSFILFNYLIFELGDRFLQNSVLKPNYRILIGLLNTFLIIILSLLPGFSAFVLYTSLFLLLFIEFAIFYKEKVLPILVVILSILLNFMCARGVCITVISLITGKTFFSLMQDELWIILSTSIFLIIANVMMIIVKTFLSQEKARIVTEHFNQLIFLTIWTATAACYMLFLNTGIYSLDIPYDFISYNQLGVSIAILLTYYIVLTFAIKVGESALIVQENVELVERIENEVNFKESVLSDAISSYEINVTKDLLIKGFEQSQDLVNSLNRKFSLIVDALTYKFIHRDDFDNFVQVVSVNNLLKEYKQNKKEIEVTYRRLVDSDDFIWAKATINIFKEAATGDIKAFIYVKNIHEEKMNELALEDKAKRDSLTNLFNKRTTEELIKEYISSDAGEKFGGALFIVDVDNFKTINDTIGHSHGDAVLIDLSNNLQKIFRSSISGIEAGLSIDIVGRIGGDEFMVFVKNVTDIELLSSKAQSIIEIFQNADSTIYDPNLTISCSIGIAITPKNGDSFEELYKCADSALYMSKNSGKNTYTFYENSFN